MPASPLQLVVGLTGPNASGKGAAAEALRVRGYAVHSLSDVVREEATRLGRDHSRASLVRTGRELRAACGPGVLAERILPRIRPPSVVDSIRNPGEVEALRRLPAFRLLGVVAGTETRFGRTVRRGRPGDPATLDEFLRQESVEDSEDAEGQRTSATLRLCDAVLQNDGSLEAFREALAALVGRWEAPP
jgi:dephospho-CoA kinase